MAVIGAYLSKQMAFDNSVLEAISTFSTNPKPLILLLTYISTDFLDHLMRQYPSDQYTSQKRSFFARGKERTALDNVIEAMKGVYTSIRLCEVSPHSVSFEFY
jgi:eukaryotic translation initiation factor 2C